MNRDDILKEFGITDIAQVTIPAEDMADEIVHLRRKLARKDTQKRRRAMLRVGDLFWLGLMVIAAPFWIPIVIIGKIAELLGFSLDRGRR